MMESILEVLRREPLPYTCYPYSLDATLSKIRVTFAPWRYLLPATVKPAWIADTALPSSQEIKTQIRIGWHVTVQRPQESAEEIILHTDAELAFWWKHGGPAVPMRVLAPVEGSNVPLEVKHEPNAWMAGRMLHTIMSDWPKEALADEILADDLRQIEATLRRFYKRLCARLREGEG